jgi:hypothetical protein
MKPSPHVTIHFIAQQSATQRARYPNFNNQNVGKRVKEARA